MGGRRARSNSDKEQRGSGSAASAFGPAALAAVVVPERQVLVLPTTGMTIAIFPPCLLSCFVPTITTIPCMAVLRKLPLVEFRPPPTLPCLSVALTYTILSYKRFPLQPSSLAAAALQRPLCTASHIVINHHHRQKRDGRWLCVCRWCTLLTIAGIIAPTTGPTRPVSTNTSLPFCSLSQAGGKTKK